MHIFQSHGVFAGLSVCPRKWVSTWPFDEGRLRLHLSRSQREDTGGHLVMRISVIKGGAQDSKLYNEHRAMPQHSMSHSVLGGVVVVLLYFLPKDPKGVGAVLLCLGLKPSEPLPSRGSTRPEHCESSVNEISECSTCRGLTWPPLNQTWT